MLPLPGDVMGCISPALVRGSELCKLLLMLTASDSYSCRNEILLDNVCTVHDGYQALIAGELAS